MQGTCERFTCTEEDFRNWAKKCFGASGLLNYNMSEDEFDQLTTLYSNETGPSKATKWFWAITNAGRDHLNGCTAHRFARWVSKSGQNAFWYHFTAASASSAETGFEGTPGSFFQDSCEGCEMPYVFGNRLTRDEQGLHRTIQGYWKSFAADGAPHGKVTWPAYDLHEEPVMVLGSSLRAVHHPPGEQCRFWDRFFPKDWRSVSTGVHILYA